MLLPLTHDRKAFREYTNMLETGLVYRQGSNLTRALEQAEALLERDNQPSRAIVLLTDGESHYPGAQTVAQRLATRNIPLFVLGIGTMLGGPIPAAGGNYISRNGEVVTSHLEQTSLKALAAASGGAYTDVRDDNSDWDVLYGALNRIERQNRHQRAQERINMLSQRQKQG